MKEYLSDHIIEKRHNTISNESLKEYLFDLLIEKTQDHNYLYSVSKSLYGYEINIVKVNNSKHSFNILFHVSFEDKKKDIYELINEMFLRLDSYTF